MKLNGHGADCCCEVCVLQRLDEGTEWEQSGDVLAANDYEPEERYGDDPRMAGLLAVPHFSPEEGLDAPETIEKMTDTLLDMGKNGMVEDAIIIVNTVDGEQVLFTTIERNDHIIGVLAVAQMNWHSSQIAAQNYYEEEDE